MTRCISLYGFTGGSYAIPNCDRFNDNALQIDDPTVFGNAIADSAGIATIEVRIPRRASGVTVLIQAAVPDRCAINEYSLVTFE